MNVIFRNTKLEFQTFDRSSWKSRTYTVTGYNQFINLDDVPAGLYKVVIESKDDNTALSLYCQSKASYIITEATADRAFRVESGMTGIMAKQDAEGHTGTIKFHLAYSDEYSMIGTVALGPGALQFTFGEYEMPRITSGKTYRVKAKCYYDGEFSVYDTSNGGLVESKTVTNGQTVSIDFTAGSESSYSTVLWRTELTGAQVEMSINEVVSNG